MIKRIAVIFILPAFFAWLGWYVYEHAEDFRRLGTVDAFHVIVLAAISLVMIFINGFFFKACLQKFAVHLTFREYFHLSNLSTFLNFVSPIRAGAGFRFLYLKKKYQFSYRGSTSVLAATAIIYAYLIAILGLLCVIMVYSRFTILDPVTAAAFAIIFVGISFIVFFAPTVKYTALPWLNTCMHVLQQWDYMRLDKMLILRLILITAANMIFAAALHWVAFDAISQRTHFAIVLYISMVTSLGALIGITPAGLGVVETMMLFVGHQLSVSSSTILMVALLTRSSVLLVTTLLAPVSSYLLFGNMWQPFRRVVRSKSDGDAKDTLQTPS